jgi:predicted DNA repair protein MutK
LSSHHFYCTIQRFVLHSVNLISQGLAMSLESLPALLELTGTASTRAVGLCFDEIAVNTKLLQDIEEKRKTRAIGKVMLGSLALKMMVIPAGLAVSALLPGAIVPLLTVGGLHLACEGVRHLMGKYDEPEEGKEGEGPKKTPQEFEKDRIKKVLTIDGLLSVEITVMTLGVIAGMSPLGAAAVLAGTGLIRTAWMYALIGSVISLPRVGKWLAKREGDGLRAKLSHKPGNAMIKSTPYVVKGFSIAGTVALLMIGGGLMIHGIPGAEHIVEGAIESVTSNGVFQELLLRGTGLLAGLGIGAVGRPITDALGAGIVKGFSSTKKHVKDIFKSKPANDNKAITPAITPAPVPPVPPSPPALKDVPDVKADLNTAAKPAGAVPSADQKPAKRPKRVPTKKPPEVPPSAA